VPVFEAEVFESEREIISETDDEEQNVSAADLEIAMVVRVIDGDTVELSDGRRVRYIGVDTPETVDPRRPVECFGKQAGEKNKELVEGKTVQLEKDVSEIDRYGRLLRYVYVGELMINEFLVREGYAQVTTYPPDVKYQDRFNVAQEQAREQNLGLWGGDCGEEIKEVTKVEKDLIVSTVEKSPVSVAVTGCLYDCGGADKDCSDFTTQTQAQEFFDCCNFSVGNDPMRLDRAGGEGDGVVCESLP
jgi:micrococcal nuclease